MIPEIVSTAIVKTVGMIQTQTQLAEKQNREFPGAISVVNPAGFLSVSERRSLDYSKRVCLRKTLFGNLKFPSKALFPVLVALQQLSKTKFAKIIHPPRTYDTPEPNTALNASVVGSNRAPASDRPE